MKIVTPEIFWHEREPIYSCDIHSIPTTSFYRLATAGADKSIRIWKVSFKPDCDLYQVGLEFLATLSRHSKTVNCVRFATNGKYLASAGDDAVILLWKIKIENKEKSLTIAPNIFNDGNNDNNNKENWVVVKTLRGHLEDIYDLSWSHDDKYLISGSLDNSSIIWDISKSTKRFIQREAKSFVQGVTWDPKNKFFCTLSTDKSLRIYSTKSGQCLHNIIKYHCNSKKKSDFSDTVEDQSETNKIDDGDDDDMKQQETKCAPSENRIAKRLFLDDMGTFFRRLTFSPDGSILVVPCAQMSTTDPSKPTPDYGSLLFSRNHFRTPLFELPSGEKPTIAIKFCPILFERKNCKENVAIPPKLQRVCSNDVHLLFDLPYRMIFAIASETVVLFYDTEQLVPFGYVSNIHYAPVTDITWSSDGRLLIVSSADGYCSLIVFGSEELGRRYVPEKKTVAKSDGVLSNNVVDHKKDMLNKEKKVSFVPVDLVREVSNVELEADMEELFGEDSGEHTNANADDDDVVMLDSDRIFSSSSDSRSNSILHHSANEDSNSRGSAKRRITPSKIDDEPKGLPEPIEIDCAPDDSNPSVISATILSATSPVNSPNARIGDGGTNLTGKQQRLTPSKRITPIRVSTSIGENGIGAISPNAGIDEKTFGRLSSNSLSPGMLPCSVSHSSDNQLSNKKVNNNNNNIKMLEDSNDIVTSFTAAKSKSPCDNSNDVAYIAPSITGLNNTTKSMSTDLSHENSERGVNTVLPPKQKKPRRINITTLETF